MKARNAASVHRDSEELQYRASWPGPLQAVARLWTRVNSWQQGIVIALVTVVGLEIFMRLMTAITVVDRGWTVCWRLAGVTAACMLRTKRRRWPWILLGFALSQLWTGFQIHAPAGATAVSLMANLLEVCIAAFFLPSFSNIRGWIRTPHLTWRFTIFALILAPLAGVVTAAGYFAEQNHTSYMQSAVFWFLSDSLGMVLWLPMTLVATTRELYSLFYWKNLPRTLGLFGLMIVATWMIFFGKSEPLAFAVLPILLWIALRLGFAGSVLATNVLALLTITGTLMGHGPFVLMGSDPALQIRALQIFLMISMLMALPISVVLLERGAFAEQLQEAYRAMELQATRDSLTGLSNRRRFDEVLQQEWQRAVREKSSVALLMLDADRFKAYNDHYGHLAGDEALRHVAAAMLSVVHRPTDLVARYGGEEFAILLPGSDQAGAYLLAEQVRQAVLDLSIAHIRSRGGTMTISVGCSAMVPQTNSDPSELIREADSALYAAKQNGRNRVELHQPSSIETRS